MSGSVSGICSSIEDDVLQKARELFEVCDQEGKGYVTLEELQRLGSDLPFSHDQLAAVFNRLDDDRNGFLTLDEFVEGFTHFFDSDLSPSTKPAPVVFEPLPCEEDEDDRKGKTIAISEKDDDQFEMLLEHLGAKNLLKDEDSVKLLWNHLRKENPEMVSDFENFLSRICTEIKKNQSETQNLQTALQSKVSHYEDNIEKLYEEMEQQLKAEKEAILNEERKREKRMRESLEEELHQKEKQLQDLLSKQTELEVKLEKLNVADSAAKQEITRLNKENEMLEQQLQLTQQTSQDIQKGLQVIRKQSLEEKRKRAKAALQVSESIALEREGLVKQLDLLRVINKRLQDERDEEAEKLMRSQILPDEGDRLSDIGLSSPDSGKASSRSTSSRLIKRGSVLSDYIDSTISPNAPSVMSGEDEPELESEIEFEDISREHNQSKSRFSWGNKSKETSSISDGSYRSFAQPEPSMGKAREVNPLMEEFLYGKTENATIEEEEEEIWNIQKSSPSVLKKKRNYAFPDDNSSSKINATVKKFSDPQRLFKVVFIGDSGVGKSSFIHRFCHNDFKPNFSATIGVDFQIKHVEANGQIVVMQVWDTAGQERFRSITNQYMRKADGIIIMYDVTCEHSFKNVRSWITCVKEFSDPGAVILLIGNKTDLRHTTDLTVIEMAEGLRLSEESGGLFFETSCKDGIGIDDSMLALACRLQEKEDLEIEQSLQLHRQMKRKSCCKNS